MSDPKRANMAPPRLVIDAAGLQGQLRSATASQPSARPPTDTISTFIALEMEARECKDLEELRFAMTNGTRKIAGFDEAVLFEPGVAGKWRITCASGMHKIDRQAPFIQAMDGWVSSLSNSAGRNIAEPKLFDLKADALLSGISASDVLFPYAFWMPIKARGNALKGALLLLKSEPWRPQTLSMLMPLSGAYGHAWQALEPHSPPSMKRAFKAVGKGRLAIAAAVFFVCAGFVPVPMSALAPAEVVAHQPTLVTAPIDGVISDILLPPGTMVAKDTLVMKFDDVTLRNNVELAKRSKAVAQAKYFKAVQNATASQKDVQEVAILKAEFDVAVADLAYAEEMMARSQIKADGSGLLIYSSKSDWLGRPVKTGERIMEIGNPDDTELRVELAVSDALTLSEGGDVALFLDGDPLNAVKAKITSANYRPTANGENQLVYRVNAAFADGVSRRIGLRGIARVSSGNVPLAYYLFRRPIAGVRQRFGL